MKLKTLLLAAAFAAASLTAASAATFRFAFQGDLKSLDPYSLNETFTLGMLGNVYEGLTKRDKDLKIVPGLAERWETPEPTAGASTCARASSSTTARISPPTTWCFRPTRVRAPGSDIKTRFPADTKVVKVDDHTVDFILKAPTRSCTPNGTPGTSCRRNGRRRTAGRSRSRRPASR